MTEIASLGLKVEGVNNVDKASGSLDRFSKSGDRADKSARGAAGGIKTTGVESEKSARSLTSMAGAARVAVGALAALGAYKLTSLISDVTILNSRFEQMTTVLDVVGGNAGYASDEVQKFAREVQGMGITMIESRQTVISMIQAQLDLTKASELARVAQDAAVIGNINSTEALSRLINGIKSGQVEVLRAIGINVQFEQGYKRMADQLGKSSDSLTDAERAQSRMNQVMDAGAQIAGAYEASMDSASKQLGSTTRYVEDIKVMLGEAFSIAGRDLVFGYSDALKSVNARITEMSESGDLAEIAERVSSALDVMGKAALVVAAVVGTRLTVALGSAAAAKIYATQQAIAYQAALARMAGASATAAAASTALRGSLALVGGPAGAAMLAAGAIYYFATRSSEAEKIVDRLVPAIDDATQSLKDMSAAEQELRAIQAQRELHDVNKQLQDQRKNLDELAGGYKEVTRVIQTGMGSALQTVRVPVSTEELLTAQTEMERTQKAANLLSAEIADLAFAMEFPGLSDPFGEVAESAEAASEAVSQGFDALMQGLEEQRILFEEGEIAAYRYSLAVKGFTPAEIDAAAAAKKHNDQLQENIDKREAFNSAMSAWADDQRRSLESAAAAEKQYAQSLADAIDPMSAFEREAEKIQQTFDKGLLGDISTSQLDAYIAKLREAAEEAAGIASGFDFASLENGLGTAVNEISKIQGAMQDGSKEAKVLAGAMTVLSVAQGAAAIANAMATGDPYTAVLRAVAVAAVLSQAGIDTGVSGGSSSVAEQRQATQGTGTVFGDPEAKSESIANATEITADATSKLVGINRAQLNALEAMGRAITGVTEGLIRSGGVGQIGSSMSFGSEAVLGSDFLRLNPVAALGEDLGEILSPLSQGLFDFHAGIWNDLNEEFFRVDTDLIDQGIQLFGGSFGEIISGALAVAQGYADVEKETKLFGIGLGSSASTILEDLGEETSGQILAVLSNMGAAVTAGASALGIADDVILQRLNAFELAMQKISLMDLSAEDQQAELEAVFSSIFDDLASAVVPFIDDFAKVGEGFGETLIRIATQVQVTQEAVDQLGLSILDGLAPEQLARVSDELITLSGGMEKFITGFTGFVDKFATDEHKFNVATSSINSAMSQLGLEVPQSEEALWELMQTLTDPAQIAGLLRLQDSFATMFDMMGSVARERQGLTLQLLRLQGDAEGALAIERANALDGMHESNRALQEQIWALQDLEAAADAAAQSTQALADFQRGIADQILDIVSPAHAELERLNRAMGAQIEQAQELGIAEEDLANMRRLHQLQLMEFAAGLEESISSMSDELFGTVDNGMDKTVNSVGSGMNKVRDLMISGIAQVNDWLQSSMLSSTSPLTPEQRLAEAESQFFSQVAAAQTDPTQIAGLRGLADQVLSEGSSFFGGSTQEFDDLWLRVRGAMEGVAGLAIPDAQDPQRAIQTATESTAMSALQQITLASDMIGQIAALSRVTGETPADIAERLGVPIGGLLDILESTPGEFAGAMDENFNDLVNSFDMTIDPLLSVQNAQLEATKQQTADTNERLERIEQALLDGVNYQRATAVNTGETANQQGQAVAIQRRNENKPSGAGRINV